MNVFDLGFTDKEDTVILILAKQKIEKLGGNLKPPSHQLRDSRQETCSRLGTV